MHHCIRRGETVVPNRLEENLLVSGVRGAGSLQREEIDPAKGPVQEEKSTSIGGGKLRMAIANDASWRTAAEGGDGRNHVAKVRGHPPRLGPLRRLPAIMAAGNHVIKSRRLVPGER